MLHKFLYVAIYATALFGANAHAETDDQPEFEHTGDLSAIMSSAVSKNRRPLEILHHGPNTTPIEEYTGKIDPQPIETPYDRETLDALRKDATAWAQEFRPISTPTMSPGVITPRRHQIDGLTRPICMVGADQLSLSWIQMHAERLKNLRAVCIAVEVETKQELDRLRSMLDSVPVVPTSGAKYATRFQVRRYPILITSSGIQQ